MRRYGLIPFHKIPVFSLRLRMRTLSVVKQIKPLPGHFLPREGTAGWETEQ